MPLHNPPAIEGLTNKVTAAGTTVLTALSSPIHHFTGTNPETAQLPAPSTLHLGFPFEFINDSTEAVTIKSSGNNDVTVVAAGDRVRVRVVDLAVTTAAGWAVEYFQKGSNITASSTDTLTNKTMSRYSETEYIVTGVSGSTAIDRANGGIQHITLSGNWTPASISLNAGESMFLHVIKGSNTLTLTSVVTSANNWVGKAAPTFTNDTAVISLYKIGSVVYGNYLGDVA
jgi:hypothetical protein